VLTLALLALASTSFAFTFTAFDVPGATQGTSAYGINNHGQIVGYSNGPGTHGFLRAKGGTFTQLDVPGAAYTLAQRINGHGQIVGVFVDTNNGGILRGFLAVP
jgi:probable HAF family extracellular repeat protein